MTPLETILAFLTVMGVIAIPFAAVITRKSSPIGHAIAERIRRKTERKLGPPAEEPDPGRRATPRPHAGGSIDTPDPVALIESQQQSLHEMSNRLEFLERLLEKEQSEQVKDSE